MKKIFLILMTFALFAWSVSCVKEAEQKKIEFNYNVVTPEDFSDKGVTEEVSIPIDIKTEYDFSKVPLKYKVETDKQATMRVGEEVINSGDIYELKSPELPLFYTGKEIGVHNIKVTFMNSVDNKIVRELKINYKEFGYTLEVVNAKKNVTQGENVDFSLKITPAEGAPKMDYFIVFKSYDTEKDPKLEKSTVTLNDQKIEFNKEYKIEDLSNVKITTNSFYAGTKELKYVIKNKTFAREETITQEVSQNTLTLSEGTQLSTSSAKTINEKITFIGKITKEPNLSNKIWYKTEITEGQADGLTTNDWTEVTLSKENAIENVSFLAKKEGTYKYKIIFKDEFGNEISKVFDVELKINKDFSIEVSEGKQNPHQGESVDFKLKVTPAEGAQQSEYFIIFKSYDSADPTLARDYVAFNGHKIEFDKEYKIENLANSRIKLNTFYSGDKKLKYVIKNDKMQKEGVIAQSVEKNSLVISENAQLSKSVSNIVNETIKFTGKIVKTPNFLNKVWYKTEILSGRFEGLTTNDWKEISLGIDGLVDGISTQLLKEDQYRYKISFKDEFGNETYKVFDLELKINKDFSIEVSEGKQNPQQGESVDFKLKVTPADNAQQSEYFIIFKSYDSDDPTLAKDYIAFNGQKIEFDKEYKIENLANSKIKLNTFYSGNKELNYIIKNAHKQKTGIITQNVERNSLVISENAQLSKKTSNIVNETIRFTGKIVKTPNYNNKIWYKTEIVSGAADGLSTNDWKETSLGIDGSVEGISTQLLKENQYRYKITFKDEFGNETYKVFDVELKINREFTTEITEGKQNPYQGEEVDFKLKIIPADNTPQMDYYIIFKSYDSDDPTLAKDYIAFNGQKIEFDKEYKIENLTNSRIKINTFYSGYKELRYIIKNAHKQKTGAITQNVERNRISYELNFNKEETNNINETLTLRGYITKNPKYNSKIWYKTWVSNGGVETTNNTYREYILPNDNSFSINVKTLSLGKHEYYIQLKDEFGNETTAKNYSIEVNNKNFVIDQILPDISNVYQGQDVPLSFSVNGEYDGDYKIKFISFDEQDIYLNKSVIKLNGANVPLNRLENIKGNKQNNTIVVNSFNYGVKKLIYEVYETSNEANKVRKEISINIKKAPISSNISVVDNNIYASKSFTIKGKVNHLSHTKRLKYRTKEEKKIWGVYVSSSNITPTMNNWTDITLNENDEFSLELQSSINGYYRYYIEFMDEFGNTSQEKIELNIKEPIIVEEAYILERGKWERHNITRGRINSMANLKLKVKTASSDILLTRAVTKETEKTYYYTDKNGVTHSLKIGIGVDDWDLGRNTYYDNGEIGKYFRIYKGIYTIFNSPSHNAAQRENAAANLKRIAKEDNPLFTLVIENTYRNYEINIPIKNIEDLYIDYKE